MANRKSQMMQNYQKLLATAERLEAIEAIRQGIQDVNEGKTITLEALDQKIRQNYPLSE